MPDDLKDVALRLRNLEEKVNTIARRHKVSELSAEEISAYHKVQNAFWEDGTCGINETSPCMIYRCNVIAGGRIVPIPKPWDFECTCGPCNVWGHVAPGAFRFGGLGR